MKQKKDTETTPRQQCISHSIQFAPFMRLYGTYRYWLHRYVPSKEHLEWLQVDWGLWAGIGTKFTQGQITPVLIGRYTHEC